MRVDVMTVARPLQSMSAVAQRTQTVGFDGMLFTEAGRTAFPSATVAAIAAPGRELSTGVAVASPCTTSPQTSDR